MSPGQQYRRLGKFELHEPLGEGAMGIVWKAYDSVLRRYVALKLLGSKFGKTNDMRERFLREARAAAALQHPNIITVYDLGEAEGQLFIAAAVCSYNPDLVHALEYDVVSFQIVDRSEGDGVRGEYAGNWPGVVRPMLEWHVEPAPAAFATIAGIGPAGKQS